MSDAIHLPIAFSYIGWERENYVIDKGSPFVAIHFFFHFSNSKSTNIYYLYFVAPAVVTSSPTDNNGTDVTTGSVATPLPTTQQGTTPLPTTQQGTLS